MSAIIAQQWINCQFSCHYVEDITPDECFLDIVPLKKADAESIYLALVKCIQDKNLQVAYFRNGF